MSIEHESSILAADPIALLATLNSLRAARTYTQNTLSAVSWGTGQAAQPAAGVTANNLTYEQVQVLRTAAAGLIRYGADAFPSWATIVDSATNVIEEHLLEVAQVISDSQSNQRCVSCSSTCARACELVCYGTCTVSCDSTCTTICSRGTCTGSCSSGCSACGNTCSGVFLRTCGSACSGGCSSGCEGTCRNYCLSACTGISCWDSCKTNCHSSCDTTCATACTASCSHDCYNSCTGYCTDACTIGTRQFTSPASL